MASTTEWNLGDIPKADSIFQVAHRYRSEMAPWDIANLDWLQGWFDGDREAIYRAGQRWAELDPSRGGDCRGARMSNHLRQAVEGCLKWYDRSFDKTGLLGFFWTDFLVSLHLLGEHETELEHARIARQYNPSQYRAFRFEAWALAALGRVDELRALLREASTHETDFRTGSLIYEAGLELRAHGQRELGDELLVEAVDWFESRGDTNVVEYAQALFASGRYGETRTVSERCLQHEPDNADCLGLWGSAAAALGDRSAAMAASERLIELEAQPYVFGGPTSRRAGIAAMLGDRDEAVRLLQLAYEEGASYGMGLHNAHAFDGLRGYPPFERFIAPKE
jgi:tetratricopeptide (TPR) repeat protein